MEIRSWQEKPMPEQGCISKTPEHSNDRGVWSLDGMMTSQNMVAGFEATGISPFNPNQVLKRLPQQPVADDGTETMSVNEAVSLVVIDMLKEMRERCK